MTKCGFNALAFLFFFRWFGVGGTKFYILSRTFAFGYGLRMPVQEDVLFLKIAAV